MVLSNAVFSKKYNFKSVSELFFEREAKILYNKPCQLTSSPSGKVFEIFFMDCSSLKKKQSHFLKCPCEVVCLTYRRRHHTPLSKIKKKTPFQVIALRFTSRMNFMVIGQDFNYYYTIWRFYEKKIKGVFCMVFYLSTPQFSPRSACMFEVVYPNFR